MSAVSSLSRAARQSVQRRSERRRFAADYSFEDRRSGARHLVLILAGYKEHLWPWVFPRFLRGAPADADVCIASSGRHVPELARIAAENGWSYLASAGNQISVVQNLAIREHPDARMIVKVDEDIFVPDGFFGDLLVGFERVKSDGLYTPGICSPVLNVNGYSYVNFLETLGLLEAYVERFGERTRRSGLIKATDTGEGALWLWERSLPLDEVAAKFAALPFGYSAVPHRFSIGAIAYERDLWEEMGGFWLGSEPPGLGADEEQICRTCMSLSRVIVVLDNLFAGHFAFGVQEPAMRAALPRLASGLGPA